MSERERFLQWYMNEFGDHDDARQSRPFAWAAWQAACTEGWQCVPVEPTDEMIEAGARRLVNWPCDGLVWPDSWDALDVVAARNEAERVIRSALSAAFKPEDAE